MEAQDAGLYYRGIDRIGWTDLVPRHELRKHGSSQDWSYMEGQSYGRLHSFQIFW